MKSTVLNEINNMKYLFNYDRSKTINEQQETPVPTPPAGTPPVPTPPATGSTVGSGPIPAPADGESSRPLPPPVTPPAPAGVGGNNSVMPNTSGNEGQATSLTATSLTPGNNTGGANNANTSQASSASAITPGGSGDPYQYKFEDDGTTQKYYYAKKGQENWKQSTNPKSVEAIKKNIFKIR